MTIATASFRRSSLSFRFNSVLGREWIPVAVTFGMVSVFLGAWG